MPSNEAKKDLRLAKLLALWSRCTPYLVIVVLVLGGMVLGGFATSVYDRQERMAIAKRYDDEMRDFRLTCRRTVDEQRRNVIEATDAAARAATAAADAVSPTPTGAPRK